MSKDFCITEKMISAIETLKSPGELFEVRILGYGSWSGYFTDAAAAAEQIGRQDLKGKLVTILMNQLSSNFDYKDKLGVIKKNAPGECPKSNDVIRYRWLFIDLDPKRKPGISSTASELKSAETSVNKILPFMSKLGFERPVIALSGNGYHVLYRIDLENNTDSENLLKAVLETISRLFSNNEVDVDTVNYNPARLIKLYGTLAQKGDDTEERPHRMSALMKVPAEVKITPIEVLRKLAAEGRKLDGEESFSDNEPQSSQEKGKDFSNTPNVPNVPTEKFDVDKFMSAHGLQYFREVSVDGGRRRDLIQCPFNSTHRNAAVFLNSDGRIGFKCFHNSCQGYSWGDVRELYEPGYKDRQEQRRKEYEEQRQKFGSRSTGASGYEAFMKAHPKPQTEQPEQEEGQPPKGSLEYFDSIIRTEAFKPLSTGLKFFDDLFGGGLLPQSLTVLVAAPGAGKTMLCQQIAEAIATKEKQPVIYVNLEMSNAQMYARALSARTQVENSGSALSAVEVLQAYKWTSQQAEIYKTVYDAYKREAAPYVTYIGDVMERSEYVDNILAYAVEAAKVAQQEGKRSPALIIDYLHLVKDVDDKGREMADAQQLLKSVMKKLKDYAIRQNTFIIAVSASTKDANNNGEYGLSSGRDSSNIEYTADNMLSLNYEEVVAPKNREGRKIRPNTPEFDALRNAPLPIMHLRIHKSRMTAQTTFCKRIIRNGRINRFYAALPGDVTFDNAAWNRIVDLRDVPFEADDDADFDDGELY